jgi:hypothetical protein
MNIYQREFLVLYKYYSKYGDGETESAIENAKNTIAGVNGLFSFGAVILLMGGTIKFAPRDITTIVFSDYKGLPFMFFLFILIFMLNKLIFKRLDFNRLSQQSRRVKTTTWWLSIYSGIFILLSIVLVSFIL